MSICPSVVITIAPKRKYLRTSNFATRLILAIGRSELKSGHIDQQDLHKKQTGILGSWAHGKSDSYQI